MLELFLESYGGGIALSSRLDGGVLLSLPEIESLCAACGAPISAIRTQLVGQQRALPRVESLANGAVRASRPTVTERVSSAVSGTRLQVIRDYLGWLVRLKCSMPNTRPELRESLIASSQITLDAISARIPKSRAGTTRREGLGEDANLTLLSTVNSGSADNPWRNHHTRVRNALIFDWLHHLGLRRGELLNVQISDIDFAKQMVSITRRPDHVKDPRRYQPNVKTRSRNLPLSPALLDRTRTYIISHRAHIKSAKKHAYLFVAGSGQPLSIPAFSKMFASLKARNPKLPAALTSHALRHTWNDSFSEEMDEQRIGEDTETKLRAYLMGWSPTSVMAATYTRRHIKKKAQEASIKLQKKIMGESEEK